LTIRTYLILKLCIVDVCRAAREHAIGKFKSGNSSSNWDVIVANHRLEIEHWKLNNIIAGESVQCGCECGWASIGNDGMLTEQELFD
jgi:hypothetical protein